MLWCDISRAIIMLPSSSSLLITLIAPCEVITTAVTSTSRIEIISTETSAASLEVIVLRILAVHRPRRSILIRRRLCIIIVVLTLWTSRRGESSLLLMILRVLTEKTLASYHKTRDYQLTVEENIAVVADHPSYPFQHHKVIVLVVSYDRSSGSSDVEEIVNIV